MMQFTLNLNSGFQRPIVLLKDFHNISAMLDTGALFPVWTDDESILTSLLYATLIQKDVEFGGFGGKAKGNLYRKNFVIGKLIFPNMCIIACNELKNSPFSMILSATMFQKMIYEIDDKNNTLNVTIPDRESNVRNLTITDQNGQLHVLCNSEED